MADARHRSGADGWAAKASSAIRRRSRNFLITALRTMLKPRDDWRVIIAVGLRRTGNHAVINWIKHQVDGPFLFYNNILAGEAAFLRFERELRFGGFSRPTLLLSYEDRLIDDIFDEELRGILADYACGARASAHLALILRDPHNLLASRAKRWPKWFARPEAREKMVTIYKEHARVFLGDAPPPAGVRLAPVNYNSFVADAGYRRRLAEHLETPFTDRGRDEVTSYGRGSSFDGQMRDGAAASMDVLGRWRAFENDPDFRAVVGDPVLIDLAQRVFGDCPPGLDRNVALGPVPFGISPS